MVTGFVLTLVPMSDASAQSGTYRDVLAGSYYTQPITELAKSGVFQGTDCAEGMFCPDRPLLRWEMAVWVVRVVDGTDPEAPAGGSRFGDVAGDLWWAAHVERMYELGITSGCGDGTNYCPNEPIKRSHMAVFLARAFDLTPGPHPGFRDVNSVSDWFHDEVIALARSGITAGCGSGYFCASEDTTRAQMATFLHRANQSQGNTGASCSFVDHADRVTGAVFQVHSDGLGTAFLIGAVTDGEGDGVLWLTAAHVVGDRRQVTLTNGDVRLNADVVAIDTAIDTAMLRASAGDFKASEPLRFGRAEWLKPGTDLYAVGYPLHVASQPTVSRGVLSRIEGDTSLARTVVSEGTLILTDAPINPGNSGGPLVDVCGSVIGMNVAGVAAVDVEGINWAVAESTIRERYDSLMQGSLPENTDTPTQIDWEAFEGEYFDGTYTGAKTVDDDSRSELLVRCTNYRDLEVFVVSHGSFMTGHGWIEYRFSGLEEVDTSSATVGSSENTLFLDDTWSLLFDLGTSQHPYFRSQLFIRLWTYTDFDDDSTWIHHGDAAFSTAGFDKVGQPVIDECEGIIPDLAGDYKAVAAGDEYSCAIRTDDSLTCWGSNVLGTDAPTGTFKAIASSRSHSCAVRTDDTIACWGSNTDGATAAPTGTFKTVAVGLWHSSCAIRMDDTIVCWGSNDLGETDAPAGTYKAIASGFWHTCAIRMDNTITCWGFNESGQTNPPAGHYKVVTAGGTYSCAIRMDDTLVCWGGSNVWASPTAGTFKAVAAGFSYSCAIRMDDTIACWGSHQGGATYAPGGTFKALVSGDDHSCAIRSEGSITCWSPQIW